MSTTNTGGIGNLMLSVIIVSFLSFFIVSLGYVLFYNLSIEQRIQFATPTLTITSIVFVLLAIAIYAYRTVRYFSVINKSSVVAQSENIKLTKTKLFIERISSVIQSLGNSDIKTRIAAIYALELIAKDSPDAEWTVMEIITAFVRDNQTNFKLDEDVQIALKIIGRRANSYPDDINHKLDLRHTNISGANLARANFRGADFYQANLESTNLFLANLHSANLMSAKLDRANLFLANLQSAVLTKATMNEANLSVANLTGAILTDADLYLADFSAANLHGAVLNGAILHFCDFSAANLHGAILHGAKLQGADLTGAKNLEFQQILLAQGDRTTRLPSHLQQPEHWGVRSRE